MNEGPLRVLLIEDDEDDFLLTKGLFAELPAGAYHLDRVADFASALQAFDECQHDAYLVDYRLGQNTGLELIAEALRRGCHAPMIMLTGQRERELDLQAMQAGAADYLVKDKLSAIALERSMRYALLQHRHRDAIRDINQQLEQHVQARTLELVELNKTLEEEIAVRKRVEERLREIDRKKDAFLATLAHELRNPLAALSSATQLIGMDPEPEELPELAAVMARQLAQLVRLIDDLLDVSRISGGKLQLRTTLTSLAEPITAALDVSRPVIDEAGHRLLVSLPEDPLFVHGDAVRLTQIINNLLINAAKYTPPGGEIELLVGVEDSEIAILVRDSGVGIPAEKQAGIFEMFAQVDSSRTRSSGGLGIGLSLAKSLAEMHGGSIRVSSAGPGQGSEFTVRLPRAASLASVAVEGVPEVVPRVLPCYRVLVVDDNESAAYLISQLLAKLGQEVQIANSAAAALELIPRFLPDLVISDVAMPEMSGLELAARIRAGKELKQPRLVALSGYGRAGDRDEALAAGFDLYRTKPIGLPMLEQLLAEVGK